MYTKLTIHKIINFLLKLGKLKNLLILKLLLHLLHI